MSIENKQIKVSQVVTSAVCCTTNLTLEAVNDFLAQVWREEENDTPPTHTLTLIHDLETYFWGTTKELQGEDPETVLQSPFTGLDYSEIRKLLMQMKEASASKLKTDWFLVLDGRSVETNSAVIVNVEPHGTHTLRSSVRSLRVDYPTSSRYLAAASIAHPSINELKEVVDGNPDKFKGILRDD
ncbi:hypothetical protein M409DRAFT_30781 [Zasmidium cellare ATCC 36951]|uniref:Uncharacterized protein n=1 Tax=Zasmidium cellare ATCC 36951 TaxID=1080233 RepID=A0A6A6BYU6_ZASCE|nr:uncharacterized protein M409DRAFT_30781 [Zasmidium cellare ATCC 36951]KAF2158689.1 hypothetical protein M409DRAFT_30781 [Zasmidium cellare ATCC 36951]